MRVLITVSTGEIERRDVLTALAPLGWLPAQKNEAFVARKLQDVLGSLPADVRAELAETEPILIEVKTGIWGLCSLEREQVVNFRLFSDDPEQLRDVAEAVVSKFPLSLERLRPNATITFPENVEIRKRENEDRIFVGAVPHRARLPFNRWVAVERRRERRALQFLAAATVICVIVSVTVYTTFDSKRSEYIREWVDRAGTAFLVTLLSLLVNLMFEYREWRRVGHAIDWSIGPRREKTETSPIIP